MGRDHQWPEAPVDPREYLRRRNGPAYQAALQSEPDLRNAVQLLAAGLDAARAAWSGVSPAGRKRLREALWPGSSQGRGADLPDLRDLALVGEVLSGPTFQPL